MSFFFFILFFIIFYYFFTYFFTFFYITNTQQIYNKYTDGVVSLTNTDR